MAEPLDGGVDESGDLVNVGEVALVRGRLYTEPLELADNGLRLVLAPGRVVVDHDVRAVRGERLGEQLAEVRGAAGDDRDLS